MVHFYGIYGVGAVIIIVFAQYFNKNNFTLFLGGYTIGTVTEYLISFLVEVILHTKWWDYSNNLLNINGRVCLLYSIFWGILTIFLIKRFNPIIDQIINKVANKMSLKLAKGIVSFIIVFLMLDCMATCYAQDIFITRMVIKNDIPITDRERREEACQKIQEKEHLTKFIDAHWNDKKMIQTFPNMKIEDSNHNIIYLDSLLPQIQPYYRKIFEKE
ncbi:MAG: putative ABC transporter permease [Clostridia bacterium]|nr:putative ABC transporter permease [Clostridia bacterium]